MLSAVLGGLSNPAKAAGVLDGEWSGLVTPGRGRVMEGDVYGCAFNESPATMSVLNGKAILRFKDVRHKPALFEGVVNSSSDGIEFQSGNTYVAAKFSMSFEDFSPAKKFDKGSGTVEQNIFSGKFRIKGRIDGFQIVCKFAAHLKHISSTIADTSEMSGTAENQPLAILNAEIETQRLAKQDQIRQQELIELKKQLEDIQRLAEQDQKRQQELAALNMKLEEARLVVEAEARRLAEEKQRQEKARKQAEDFGGNEIQQQIAALKRLRESGLISDTEFLDKKTAVLNAFLGLSEEEPPAADDTQNIFADIDFGRYFALIIGNNKHEMLPNLITAIPDARDISRILETNYGFSVNTLYDASRRDIFRALQNYRNKLSQKDNLLIYYAGHGYLDEVTARGYWLPVDADPSFKSDWISNADITDALKSVKSQHVMVIADSCYSGTLIRSANVQIDNASDRKALLNRLLEKRSRTVMTSGGLEPVMDGGGGGHSVFANAFIHVLEANDTVIEAQQIFNLLRPKVIVNSDQTPEYSDVRMAGHDGGDFLFVPKNNE